MSLVEVGISVVRAVLIRGTQTIVNKPAKSRVLQNILTTFTYLSNKHSIITSCVEPWTSVPSLLLLISITYRKFHARSISVAINDGGWTARDIVSARRSRLVYTDTLRL